jgi:hypothetical protein
MGSPGFYAFPLRVPRSGKCLEPRSGIVLLWGTAPAGGNSAGAVALARRGWDHPPVPGVKAPRQVWRRNTRHHRLGSGRPGYRLDGILMRRECRLW